jgi:hypothetical protein
MREFRRRLTGVAGAWLAAQLAFASAAPVALRAAMPTSADAVQCTCSHGDGTACPMHQAARADDPDACSCRGTSDAGAAIIASLLGDTAILTAPAPAIGASSGARVPGDLPSRPLELDLVPDSPPPRT